MNAVWIALGAAPFLLADLWFFLAQKGSRPGQFPAFDLLSGLQRLARLTAANLFGGLPLYAGDTLGPLGGPLVAAALAVLLLGLAGLVTWRWRRIGRRDARRLLLGAAAAPPLGLLALGFAFDNTPIELRYLAFATPFAALLLAGALASLPCRARRAIGAGVLAVQALAIAGLMLRPETMQPARAAARAAAALADGGVVLLPRGNDGVGVVGAFAIEAPPDLPLLVVGADAIPAVLRARTRLFPRVVLALIEQDDASRAAAAVMRAAFDGPGWRRAAERSTVVVVEREGDEGDVL